MNELLHRSSFAEYPKPKVARRVAVIGRMLVTSVVIMVVVCVLAGPATAAPQATSLWLSAPSATLSGRDIAVVGGIGGISSTVDLSGATVRVYKREVGESADTLVGTVPVTYNLMTGNVFNAVISGVVRNCIITAAWDGSTDYLASSTWMFAGVRPKLKLKVLAATRKSTRLRAEVTPAQPFDRSGAFMKPPFIAVIQCRRHGAWTGFPASLSTMSTDGESWCTYGYYHVKPGTYVLRVRFLGTNYNVASVSRAVRVTVP
jgi:hypothetical protein